ncbi:DUF3079 domain-containing protein [Limnohabitans sp.]|uniref:DUF3079 domain-containing protein n=1 Tax=Limnohabitans sp. TaxID=1907725 RepID=UPI0035AE6B3A
MKRFPDQPAHPERLCWGCDRYCASNDMLCGNGSVRTPHPVELFGPDWAEEAPTTTPVDGLPVPPQGVPHG